jgi:hypothetical protein
LRVLQPDASVLPSKRATSVSEAERRRRHLLRAGRGSDLPSLAIDVAGSKKKVSAYAAAARANVMFEVKKYASDRLDTAKIVCESGMLSNSNVAGLTSSSRRSYGSPEGVELLGHQYVPRL